ncbi:MAG TPA: heme-binding protein [Candidatus Cybelea sp.]|nr:heme-binding protein [Candidatus Cybelea sp.]
MPTLTLDQAEAIAGKALKKGRELKLKPLTVVVLDSAGVVTLLKREDGSSLLRPDIAYGKAWGCLGMGFGGREMARRAQAAPGFVSALNQVSGGRVVPVPGGVLVRNSKAQIIGAVGISGDLSEQDEACAVAGIEAAGLTPDTGG